MFYSVFLLQSSFYHHSDWASGCSLKSSIIIKEINKSPFPYKTKLTNKQIKPHRMLVVITGCVLWWFPVVSWCPQFSPQADCRQVDHLLLGYSCLFWIMFLFFHPISKWLTIAICCFYHLPKSWQSKFYLESLLLNILLRHTNLVSCFLVMHCTRRVIFYDIT